MTEEPSIRLRVISKGEPTVYYVESNTLECVNPSCHKQYNRRLHHQQILGQRWPTVLLHIGDPCPACLGREWEAQRDGSSEASPEEAAKLVGAVAVPRLDVRFHMVDISSFNGIGMCACEYFQMTLAPSLRRMDRIQLQAAYLFASKHRCHHIQAARDFALDVALKSHDRERYAGTKQREENQP